MPPMPAVTAPNRINFRRAADFVREYLGYLVDNEPGQFNLLWLQGVSFTGPAPTDGIYRADAEGYIGLAPNKNELNLYNDAIILFGVDENGQPEIYGLKGSCDPGDYYLNGGTVGGSAHITFGQADYEKGQHRGNDAMRGLNDDNRFWRESEQKNQRPDPNEPIYVAKIGLNIHAGGISIYVGKNSAGCSVVWGGYEGAPWKLLIKLRDRHIATGRRVIHSTWWRGSDYFAWLEHGYDHYPHLFPGTKGPWVTKMQHLINLKAGKEVLVPDGDWRGGTTKAVLAVQKEGGLAQDAWVYTKTWSYLLGRTVV